MNESRFWVDRHLLIRQAIAAWVILFAGVILFTILALVLSTIILNKELVIIVAFALLTPSLVGLHIYLSRTNYYLRYKPAEITSANLANVFIDIPDTVRDRLRETSANLINTLNSLEGQGAFTLTDKRKLLTLGRISARSIIQAMDNMTYSANIQQELVTRLANQFEISAKEIVGSTLSKFYNRARIESRLETIEKDSLSRLGTFAVKQLQNRPIELIRLHEKFLYTTQQVIKNQPDNYSLVEIKFQEYETTFEKFLKVYLPNPENEKERDIPRQRHQTVEKISWNPSQQGSSLVLREVGNVLVINEVRGGAMVSVMRITAGSVTKAQLAYYEANLKGRIKQIEADLILKYFYGLE